MDNKKIFITAPVGKDFEFPVDKLEERKLPNGYFVKEAESLLPDVKVFDVCKAGSIFVRKANALSGDDLPGKIGVAISVQSHALCGENLLSKREAFLRFGCITADVLKAPEFIGGHEDIFGPVADVRIEYYGHKKEDTEFSQLHASIVAYSKRSDSKGSREIQSLSHGFVKENATIHITESGFEAFCFVDPETGKNKLYESLGLGR
ncbi:hypothetical protein ACFLQ2_03915 [archaeon]